jgi:hypothetical protein
MILILRDTLLVHIFKGQGILKDMTGRLSRNIGKNLPFYAA